MTSGLSGQYGALPYSMIRERYEVTNENFDPENVRAFMMDGLRDVRPDAPFHASDLKREDTGAEERLSIRFTGHRSGEVPDRPDEFLELTEKDPRGTALQPNFSLAREQSESRAQLVRFYPDADYSVTEREAPAGAIQHKLRDAFEQVKDRLKIFTTSKDGIMGARNYRMAKSSTSHHAYGSVPLSAVAEATSQTNQTTLWSNTIPVGWDRVTDNEFKVSSYGASNGGLSGFRGDRVDTATSAKVSESDNSMVRRAEQTLRDIVSGQGLRTCAGENMTPVGVGSDAQQVAVSRATSRGDRLDPKAEAFWGMSVAAQVANRAQRQSAPDGLRRQDAYVRVREMMDTAVRQGAKSSSRNPAADISATLNSSRGTESASTVQHKFSGGPASSASRSHLSSARVPSWMEGKSVAPLGRRALQPGSGKEHMTLAQQGWKAHASSQSSNTHWKPPATLSSQAKTYDTVQRAPSGTVDSYKGKMGKWVREQQESTASQGELVDV